MLPKVHLRPRAVEEPTAVLPARPTGSDLVERVLEYLEWWAWRKVGITLPY